MKKQYVYAIVSSLFLAMNIYGMEEKPTQTQPLHPYSSTTPGIIVTYHPSPMTWFCAPIPAKKDVKSTKELAKDPKAKSAEKAPFEDDKG